MTRQHLLAAALCVGLSACAGGSGGPSPDSGLAYGMPSTATAQYMIADTMEINVDSPMGSMTVPQTTEATLDVTFSNATGGLGIAATIADYKVTMENPMTGAMSADESDVSGAFDLVLSRTGEVSINDVPTASGNAANLSGFRSMSQSIFPRLPDATVMPGESWVDTVTWSGTDGPAEIATTSVVTSTVVGDTIVDGRTVVRVDVSSTGTMETETNQQGAVFVNELETSATGFFFFDTSANLLVAYQLDREVEGIVTVEGMGIPPMSVTGEGPVRLRLIP